MKEELEHFFGFFGLDMASFATRLEGVKAQWDGKESGILEDRAHIATEIQDKLKEVEELIAELHATL